MTEPSLLVVCAAAFAAVLFILSLLAGLIRVLTALFPHVEEASDTAVLAAITSAVAQTYPGTRITNIQEHR